MGSRWRDWGFGRALEDALLVFVELLACLLTTLFGFAKLRGRGKRAQHGMGVPRATRGNQFCGAHRLVLAVICS